MVLSVEIFWSYRWNHNGAVFKKIFYIKWIFKNCKTIIFNFSLIFTTQRYLILDSNKNATSHTVVTSYNKRKVSNLASTINTSTHVFLAKYRLKNVTGFNLTPNNRLKYVLNNQFFNSINFSSMFL